MKINRRGHVCALAIGMVMCSMMSFAQPVPQQPGDGDSRALRVIRALRFLALEERIDRIGLSYSEQAIVRSVRRTDNRLYIVSLMIDHTTLIAANERGALADTFRDVLSFLDYVRRSPDDSTENQQRARVLEGEIRRLLAR